MGIPLGGGGVCSEEVSPKNKRARDKKGRGVEEVRLEGDDRGEMEVEEKREREMEGGRSQKGREGGKNLELLPQSFMCLSLLASQSTTFFFSHWGGGQRRDRGPIPLGIKFFFLWRWRWRWVTPPPLLPSLRLSARLRLIGFISCEANPFQVSG